MIQPEDLTQYSLDRRQFYDFRQATLPDGQRIIEAYNAGGLQYTLLPDRGLDIWMAHYKGLPLTWISAGSPYRADFHRPWLELFNGGLLVTCGLTHAGPPEADARTGESRDLHGDYTRLSAHDLSVTEAEGQLHLTGSIHQGRLFGDQLTLRRTYTLDLNAPVIALRDVVTNHGDQSTPFMILYHFNPGYPLVRAGTNLHVNHAAVYPRDEPARRGFATWDRYDAPQPGYAEQVFFHHMHVDEAGWARAALLNDDFGMEFAWDASALPYLTQWKNTRQGIYVCGVEPGNCIPEGRNSAREAGRLQMLEPGESVEIRCRLTALEGDALESTRAAIATGGGRATGAKLDDYRMRG